MKTALYIAGGIAVGALIGTLVTMGSAMVLLTDSERARLSSGVRQ